MFGITLILAGICDPFKKKKMKKPLFKNLFYKEFSEFFLYVEYVYLCLCIFVCVCVLGWKYRSENLK